MTAIEAARAYITAGFYPLPIPYRQKKPVIEGWPNLRLNLENLPQYFEDIPQNIGILLGDESGTADIDCDCVEAVAAAAELAPNTGMVFGRKSKRASHYFYRCHPPVPSQKFADPNASKKTLVELRCQKAQGTLGFQTVVPPSVHISGELIEFEAGSGYLPSHIDSGALKQAASRIAASALLARNWPREGSVHDAFLALTGVLARNEWAVEESIVFIRSIARAIWGSSADLQLSNPLVVSTFEKYREGGQTTGIPRLMELTGELTVRTALKWLGISEQSSVESREWLEPAHLQGELPPVESMEPELVPEGLRALIEDVAERMQVPWDFPAVIAVLTLSGAVNRRASVQPKEQDVSWNVVPNLWGGIVAPPGFMKSPVIQAVTRPLNEIQEEWWREFQVEQEEFLREKEEADLRRAAWRDLYKMSAKAGKCTPARPEDQVREPKLRRLIVHDATFEALHQTMSENPAGILVIRDELTGWWAQLEKPGREGERAFCLQAWNGDTGHTIDRIGRGTIHVEACCMSMLGGIQPGRLRSYLDDAVKDGPSNDGLIQRFQLLVWPDTHSTWRYVDRCPNAQSITKASGVFRRLVDLTAENPVRFRFAPDAQALFTDWFTELEAQLRGDELHPALISHLSKYRSLMPSLALLFELADPPRDWGSISLQHARQAAAWCDYLTSHARRVYSCVISPQLRAAQDLADKITKRKLSADRFFVCRDVYLKGWTGLDTPETARRALDVLEDAGWLQQVISERSPQGGRPSNRYEINPKVFR